jgi:hypothetical protein
MFALRGCQGDDPMLANLRATYAYFFPPHRRITRLSSQRFAAERGGGVASKHFSFNQGGKR